jgi:hypothetical protein
MKMLAMIIAVMFVHSAFADGISIDPTKGIDAGKSKITNLGEPGLPDDAATKGYTDAQVAGHAANTSAHHARYTDGEAVAAILAADGAGSGLDADKLAGHPLSHFVMEAGYGGYIPIPPASLFLDNAILDSWGVVLPASGTSSFTINSVVPKDIYYWNTINSTELIVEIMVYYPGSAGACQAVIEPIPKDRASYLRVAFQDGYYNASVTSDPFPPFVGANSSLSQEYKLTGVPPESPFRFEISRKGDDPADNCGDVRVAGVAIRYPQQGHSNSFW